MTENTQRDDLQDLSPLGVAREEVVHLKVHPPEDILTGIMILTDFPRERDVPREEGLLENRQRIKEDIIRFQEI